MALRMYERVLGVRSLDRCLGAGRWGGGERDCDLSCCAKGWESEKMNEAVESS